MDYRAHVVIKEQTSQKSKYYLNNTWLRFNKTLVAALTLKYCDEKHATISCFQNATVDGTAGRTSFAATTFLTRDQRR